MNNMQQFENFNCSASAATTISQTDEAGFLGLAWHRLVDSASTTAVVTTGGALGRDSEITTTRLNWHPAAGLCFTVTMCHRATTPSIQCHPGVMSLCHSMDSRI